MHTQPMADSDGEFSIWKEADQKCNKCKEKILYRSWDSSCGGYTDYKYQCKNCGYYWWVDGIDS